MKISLIIPSYKNPKYLRECLKAAIKGKVNPNTEIIVVIDGYKHLYDTIQKDFSEVKYLIFEKNQGLQASLNYGVWQSQGDWIFVINEDNILPPDWDALLLDHHHNEDIVYTINQIEPQSGIYNFHVKDLGTNVETFVYDDFVEYEKQIREKRIDNTGGILPFYMLKRWYMMVGGWDTYYSSPFIVDWDFFLKLELTGKIEFKRSYYFHVYHFGSKSTKSSDILDQSEINDFYKKENMAAIQFQYKWGFPPKRDIKTNSHMPSGHINGIYY